MDDLSRLQVLQLFDSRISGLERQLEAIPVRIRGIREGYQQAKATVDALRAKHEAVRKEIRTKEKDLDYQASQRAKCEAKLYEVKTNKEYSAVLAELEIFKVEKGRIEEEVLALMELQERMVGELREADGRLRRQEQEAGVQETEAAATLATLEAEVAGVRSERESLAREVPRDLLGQYTRLLKVRGGVAVALVEGTGICTGCRVSLPPQRFQEIRNSGQILTCESCGRILYYKP